VKDTVADSEGAGGFDTAGAGEFDAVGDGEFDTAVARDAAAGEVVAATVAQAAKTVTQSTSANSNAKIFFM